MRPCATPPMRVRTAEFGGDRPLICVPLVAGDLPDLVHQAAFAHSLSPDVVEWRADSFRDLSTRRVSEAVDALRAVLSREVLIFTLRASEEGGAKPLAQDARAEVIRSVLTSGHVDLVDVELRNGPDFIGPIARIAREHHVRLILSFHDFRGTPSNDTLLAAFSEMVLQEADMAKIACMPNEPGDVLRLLEVTLAARRRFPALPLCTMSMGSLGVLSRVAGFLFGSDMSFAVGQASSAPGQIPIGELRGAIDALHRYA